VATRKQILAHVKKQYGVKPDFPWDSTAHAVLRHKANRKWFGVIMEITEGDLGLNGHRVVDVINLKCDPIMIGGLMKEPGVYPAYHMNKGHWVSILLDSRIPSEKVFALIGMSYDLTKPKERRLAGVKRRERPH